jgi:hypothetical protein
VKVRSDIYLYFSGSQVSGLRSQVSGLRKSKTEHIWDDKGRGKLSIGILRFKSGDVVESYRDLIAWKKAKELALDIYVCTKEFPKNEVYGLMVQMRRSAVSVPSNIAEGKGRYSQRRIGAVSAPRSRFSTGIGDAVRDFS